MNYKKMIMSAICLFIFIGVLNGYFYSGNKLLNHWHDNPTSSGTDFQDNSIVLGYCAGVCDSWDGIRFDSPDNVTLGQISAIAIKYLRNHPETRHKAADYLLILAYEEAFPLRQNNKN